MGNEQDSLDESAACAVAHGHGTAPAGEKTLIAAFASPVAEFLLHFAGDAGYRVVLLEPDPDRAAGARTTGYEVTGDAAKYLDATADLVVTDHHRPELGVVLRDALASPARWVGIMGNPRHPGPHLEALAGLGVADGRHRPGAPADRAEHRLPHPGRDSDLHPGRADRRPQRPPRRLLLLGTPKAVRDHGLAGAIATASP